MDVPRLTAALVDVWRASLSHPRDRLAEFRVLLSRDELDRAARYALDHHRDRFTARRAIQREILARYTGIPAADLSFAYSPNGKPSLAGPAAASGLTFSVSDSDDLAVYAIALRHTIGVDIEQLRPVGNAEAIARRHFSPIDAEAVSNALDAERSGIFLRRWVRTEAQIKARGGTVWDALSARGEDSALWTHEFVYGNDGFTGALAVDSAEPLGVRGFEWTPGALEQRMNDYAHIIA